ncbi:MAG TPA: ATP-binding protein [Candidatus Limnocylindrales bacterium]|nr:ATP-binding protein [Candidatus Limnocylindrales bacterium]
MAVADPAIIPPDEAARLAAVRRYEILDTPPDGAFERITALAARLFNVPIAIVSVVDEDRIWFKSHYGLDVEEIGRDPGLCASAILQDRPWIITDAPRDPRALANPLVAGEFGLRFYAGAPLRTSDGYNLGTVCVLDFEPRDVTADERATLEDLAALVMDELELRLASRRTVAEAREREHLNDALMSMLSHELRTPVTTIYGSAQILDRKLASIDAGIRDLVPDIVWESQRLLGLIENILVMTRLEQGRALDTTREPVLVQRLLPTIVAHEARRSPDREIRLDVPDELPLVEADPVYLAQIIGNLLSNSIKYSTADTPIDLAARAIDEEVEITVQDQGIGIPPEAREKVFELLVRTDEAARFASGAGIGLYVCRRLLEAMDGRIWIDPVREQGTRVIVRLRAFEPEVSDSASE